MWKSTFNELKSKEKQNKQTKQKPQTHKNNINKAPI